MRKEYLTPQTKMLVIVTKRFIATSEIISLSGSSGENIDGSTDYEDDWE